MTATFHWYGKGVEHLANGDLDFGAHTFKVMLCTSSYAPNQDTDEFRSSVTNEVGASGSYASGGATLANVLVSYDSATNEVRITWDDVTFTSATITARTAVIYRSVGSAATDILVGYATDSADVISTGGTFTVDLSTVALKLTVA